MRGKPVRPEHARDARASAAGARPARAASKPTREERHTRQRDAIREVFAHAQGPLAPHQVLDAARTGTEGLGIATVYRTIKRLCEAGWLTCIELPGAAAVYERSGKAHHHHFWCDHCRRVFDLSGCLPGIHRLAGHRFRVARHEVLLYGTCADCHAPSR